MTEVQEPLGLFEGYGIELEYMIVDRDTLAVMPVCDRLISVVAGEGANAYEPEAPIAWSNELVLHVVELKTNGPASSLTGLSEAFHADVRRVDDLLGPLGARLLPTAMHPTMDPDADTRLWPHEQGPIYAAYDRIFDCRGHGSANFQSTHINLPFSGDGELHRLHSALRVLLPLVPALAASSPIVGGKPTGLLDTRLDFYRHNQDRVPSIAGLVVPDPIDSMAEYHHRILAPMYQDIAPHDPEAILQEEWLNSRGVIARFDRSALELRLLDVQECPTADIAIARLVSETVRALTEQRWATIDALDAIDTQALHRVLLATIAAGERVTVDERGLLTALGWTGASPSCGELWDHLAREVLRDDVPDSERRALDLILTAGPVSRRILRRLGTQTAIHGIREVYLELADCLALNRQLQ